MPMIRNDLYLEQQDIYETGYMIPFGDGPHPIYERRVGKCTIQNMLSGATSYAWKNCGIYDCWMHLPY